MREHRSSVSGKVVAQSILAAAVLMGGATALVGQFAGGGGEGPMPIDYLGQPPPGDEPLVFAKGTVSMDGKNTHAVEFSPDGRLLIFSRYPDGTSFRMVRSGSGWSSPEPTSFHGKEVSFDAVLKRLFFYDRDDLYYVGYGPDGFSQPTRLPPAINTTEMEYYPCITSLRNLYFSRSADWRTARIMRAKLGGDGFGTPVDLGDPINSGGASHAFIAPDESYMLFNSPRAGSFTQNDIWVSFRMPDGAWGAPVNLEERINREARAVLCPKVSPDGRYLFFTRLQEGAGPGLVYWVSTAIIHRLRQQTTQGVSFIEPGQQLNRFAARGVALADFNGDGFLDAFVVNQASPDGVGHRVYFGDGHGQFQPGPTVANPQDAQAKPAVADVNGDGALDVVTGDTVWMNDGHGRFTSHPEAIERADQASLGIVRLADVNGDGRLDLVAVAEWRALRVFLNDGRGHFRDNGQQVGAGVLGALALADVDGNGTIDAVTGGWHSDASAYCPNRVWLNDGTGRFRDSGQTFDQGNNHVHGVALGDLDGDGHPDLVLAMTARGRAGKIYLNDGKGGFRDSGQSIGHSWTHNAVLGDFDGDGALDLFLVCGEPATGTPNEVWLNDGHGHFRDSGLRLGSALSWDAAAGDLNGDGRLDVFVANLRLADGSKNPPVFGGEAAEVWLNTTARIPAHKAR